MAHRVSPVAFAHRRHRNLRTFNASSVDRRSVVETHDECVRSFELFFFLLRYHHLSGFRRHLTFERSTKLDVGDGVPSV